MMNSPALQRAGSMSQKCSGIHEMKTELSLLLESLKYHINCPDAQKTALSTLSTMLLHSDEAKETFRKCGGLLFVRTLLTSIDSEQVKVAALYTLGCALEKTMLSQKTLCDASIFQFLHSQLRSEQSSNQFKILSTFLILCLVTNNSEGQMIVRESKCLDVLLNLFRNNKLRNSLLKPEEDNWLDDIKEDENEYNLWKSVTSCLCGCVNNPQNVDNQLMCASVFPAALYILEKTNNQDIIRLVLSFISLTVANNEKNQNRIGMLGGLKVLVDVLHDQVKMLQMHPTSETMHMTEHIASAAVSCIEDNEESHLLLADLHIIPLLLQTLSMDSANTSTKLQLVLTLVQCTDSCEASQRQFIACDGVTLLVQLMSEIQEEEFSKTATYLLQICLASQKSKASPSMRVMVPEFTSKKRDFLQHYRHQNYKTPLAAGTFDEGCQYGDTQMPIARKQTLNNSSTEITQNLQAMVQTMVEVFQKTMTQPFRDTPEVTSTGDVQKSQKNVKEVQQTSAITQNSSKNDVTSNQKSSEDDECVLDVQPQDDCTHAHVQNVTRKSETAVDLSKTPVIDLQKLNQRLEHLEKSIQKETHHRPDPRKHLPDPSTTDHCEEVTPTTTLSLVKKQPMELREMATQTPTKSCTEKKNIRNIKKGSSNRTKIQSEKSSSTENENLALEIQQAISSHVYMNSQPSDEANNAPNVDVFKKPKAHRGHQKKEKAAKTPKKSVRTLYNINSHFFLSHDDNEPESEVDSCDELESASQNGRTKNHGHSADDYDGDNVNVVPSRMQMTPHPISSHNKVLDYDNCNADYDYNDSDVESVISELSMLPSVIKCYQKQHRRYSVEDWLRKSCSIPEGGDQQTEETASTSIKKIHRSHSKYVHATRKTDRSHINQTSLCGTPDVRKSKRYHSSHDNDLSYVGRSFVAASGHKSAKRVAYKVSCGKDGRGDEELMIKNQSHSASGKVPIRGFSIHKDHVCQTKGKFSDAVVIARLFKQCPGCVPPVGVPLLNSINYTHVLKNCKHTCKQHLYINSITDKFRQRVRKEMTMTGKRTDHKEQQWTVHQTSPDKHCTYKENRIDGHEGLLHSRSGNVMEKQMEEDPIYSLRKRPKQDYVITHHKPNKQRRQRKNFTDEEVENLVRGVREKGKNWNNILWTYEFQPGRTNVDLKDKYRRLQQVPIF